MGEIKTFTKKPVSIQAVQFDGTEAGLKQVEAFMGQKLGHSICVNQINLYIPTLEGGHTAKPNDWIIRGVKGEFYPCKPDIFTATYTEGAAAPSLPTSEELLNRASQPVSKSQSQPKRSYYAMDPIIAGMGGVLAFVTSAGVEVISIPQNCTITLTPQRGFGSPQQLTTAATLDDATNLVRQQLGQDGAQ